ncbi:MAG: hypothetical protein JSS68_13415 [Actinobacteria bacterium]|nr:hypothetical protein [Actinomycetota bacterium]
MSTPSPLVVLDDDPTGAQGEAGVPVALEWDVELLASVAAQRPLAVHLLTNARALSPTAAEAVTQDAAAAAAAAFPGAPVFLRGDSTLRAHLLPEYEGLRDALYPGKEPILLLVPALPAAGRVTIGGMHYLEQDGKRVPVAETDYGRDLDFAYSNSLLLEWAEERSGGRFPAARGRVVGLRELRRGPDALGAVLGELTGGGAAAVAVDSIELADLGLVAEGLRAALAAGVEVIVRCAPAFVGAFSGATADGFVEPPDAGPILVLCGSHVPASGRQLAALLDRHPDSAVWVSPERLAGAACAEEVAGAVAAAERRLRDEGLAVVATERELYRDGDSAMAGQAIAAGLAAVLAGLRERVGVVISKGGITSAVNVRIGLASSLAQVLGPLRDGVSLWSVDTPERAQLPYVVVPGNVGGDDALVDLIDLIGVAA